MKVENLLEVNASAGKSKKEKAKPATTLAAAVQRT